MKDDNLNSDYMASSNGAGSEAERTLSPEHRRALQEESAIAPEVISERVNLVHDEVVVEIDEDNTEAGRAWLERCMIGGMAEVAGPAVPASVEISVDDRWEKP